MVEWCFDVTYYDWQGRIIVLHTFQQLIFINKFVYNWDCKSIYRLLSYPFMEGIIYALRGCDIPSPFNIMYTSQNVDLRFYQLHLPITFKYLFFGPI